MATALLPFDEWVAGTLQNSVPANNNALRSEALAANVISDAITAQPGSPADGDCYIIPTGATGTQWATFAADSLAYFRGGTWYEFTAYEGLLKVVAGEIKVYNGSAWESAGGGGGGSGSLIVEENGVEVSADVSTINFSGSNVTATETSPGVVQVEFTGGGGGGGGSGILLESFTFSGNPNGIIIKDGAGLSMIVELVTSQTCRLWKPRNSGKWYLEVLIDAMGSGSGPTIGVGQSDMALGSSQVGDNSSTGAARTATWGLIVNSGSKYHGGVDSYGSSATTGDVIMMAVDMDNDRIWWGKNGTWFDSGDPGAGTGAAYTNLLSYIVPAVSLISGASVTYRLDSGDFSHSVPSGFSAWGTA